MHNMLVKYSAWSTAQDLLCPCSHSLVQNEYTIYKVESLATSTAQLVQCPCSHILVVQVPVALQEHKVG